MGEEVKSLRSLPQKMQVGHVTFYYTLSETGPEKKKIHSTTKKEIVWLPYPPTRKIFNYSYKNLITGFPSHEFDIEKYSLNLECQTQALNIKK